MLSRVAEARSPIVAQSLFDKLWQQHSVADLGDGFHLLLVDRHLVNDMGGRALITLNRRGLPLRHPELTFATMDHTVPTLWNAGVDRVGVSNPYAVNLRENAALHGFRLFDVGQQEFGIIHVISAEQGLALPGLSLACGDSHVCTLGAVGALAWGIGQSEQLHALATQTSVQRKPRNMRINLSGELPLAVTPKDVILHLIGRLGVTGGTGHAVEFAGPAVRSLGMEARFTICNMAVELGARFGLIAPDDVTFAFLEGRPYAPSGIAWEAALRDWRGLASDADAVFDSECSFELSAIEPQITWGTSPEQVIGISEVIPSAEDADTEAVRTARKQALDYIGLSGGKPIKGTPIDLVFIGSCTNGRLSDLHAAAAVARGRKVAPGVAAWVSPGSEAVRRAAEAEGLDRIFIDAGFGWGQSGCSMCAASGDQMRETAAPGKRVVSTTNRNFIGRQGPGSRTHLASPAMAAAAAVTGRIADVRELA
jgi:3-isopropylmalate/(R)-2-methylmalate dehydratase large subunit